MVKVSTLAIAGGSLLLAAGAGVYMQMSGASDSPQVAALSSVPQIPAQTQIDEPATAPEPSNADGLEIDSITLTSSTLPAQSAPTSAIIDPETNPVRTLLEPSEPMAPVLASLSDQPLSAAPDTGSLSEPEVATADDCLVDLTGESFAAALVTLQLSAPCHTMARVDFKHDGMSFSAMTDADGKIDILVPALSESAMFIAMMEDGNGAAVEMEIDTLAFYDRSVVQWTGGPGVELHAFEYGAQWGDDGHVWAGAPREVVVAARGEGGFLTTLGDPAIPGGHMAEVYTFPTGTARVGGDVALSIEVEVTAGNCNRDLSARVIEVTDAQAGKPGELTLAMPGCDAVGDFIQLKNLVSDLKIAAR